MISHPEQILETCIYVDNLDEAEKFYCDILSNSYDLLLQQFHHGET